MPRTVTCTILCGDGGRMCGCARHYNGPEPGAALQGCICPNCARVLAEGTAVHLPRRVAVTGIIRRRRASYIELQPWGARHQVHLPVNAITELPTPPGWKPGQLQRVELDAWLAQARGLVTAAIIRPGDMGAA